MKNSGENVIFIWSVGDLLRGPYRSSQYTDGISTAPTVSIPVRQEEL